MSFSTASEVAESALSEDHPPEGISDELHAMWLTKKGQWDAAHDIAQDIDTALGSWIHGHLHLLEGDIGNAGYWYSRAGKPARRPNEADAEWVEIVESLLA